MAVAPALAGPNNGTVVNGSATIQGQGTSSISINQTSQNAIINWQTFNVGKGETVQILMPNSTSAELDRVTGNLGPSQINGYLSSNGRVFLVNPNGILFGQGAQVNVGALVATTHDIANSDFMAGRYNFNIPGNPSGSVVNQGTITAQSGGFAALVAPGVRNTGTITAWLGRVGLASANSFALDLYGDHLIQLNINDSIASRVIDVSTGKPLKSLVSNEGTLRASGGRIELSAVAARQVVDSVINNSGVIEANSIGSHNGMIVLSAARATHQDRGVPPQNIKISGRLSAAGQDPGTSGGTVVISGRNVALNGAAIDASGTSGGGAVLIGRNRGGRSQYNHHFSNHSDPLEFYKLPNISNVSLDTKTVIDASATVMGNGGKVVLWSDLAAFYGTILAHGGTEGGNGGFVKTSGQELSYTGRVDTSAPKGNTGEWLLEAPNLTVDSRAAATISSNLATSNVLLLTDSGGNAHAERITFGSGSITLNGAISWTSTNKLTLDAYNAIAINRPITGPSGALALNAGSSIAALAAIAVDTFNLQNGNWSQIASILPSFSATDFIISGGSFLRVTGGDGAHSPYQIADIYGLQGIGSSSSLLAANYVVAKNIDASGTAKWNNGAGFVPIGDRITSFTGQFDGGGNTIASLTISRPENFGSVGLFGFVGSNGVVKNVGLIGGNITGGFTVGALVGWNSGTVSNVYATSAVTGLFGDVGGLIGYNNGSVTGAYSSGAVTGSTNGAAAGGGLIGWNDVGGTITDSYASGMVTGFLSAGGLVGGNFGTIKQSYATGAVTSTDAAVAGGLVGFNFGTISQSYATGAVAVGNTGAVAVGNNELGAIGGGLVGINSGTIDQSYATGSVTVGAFGTGGGLVGINGIGDCCEFSDRSLLNVSITNSYAIGTVSSSGIDVTLGGLVGANLPGSVISNSQAYGNVISTADIQPNENNKNCFALGNCQFGIVGGFAGANYGTITGTSWAARPGSCAESFVCASGNVSVASGSRGGGFSGLNQGTISFAFATGNVSGVAGLPSSNGAFNDTTQLGGFVADNQGAISNSFAKGMVGTGGTAYLTVGGFAASNEGSISNALATGAVLAGDFSSAGGFVGSNSATISNSQAFGNVTAGASSIAGGFASISGGSQDLGGSFTNVTASGIVTADHDSIIGGLVGLLGENTTLSNSLAQNTKVASTGANSIIGGIVGINVGTVSNTNSTAPVSGTSASYIGGVAGINAGVLNNVSAGPEVSGSGDHNFIGGIAGLNVGSISNSTAQVTITSDSTSYVGGLVGLNGSYLNVPLSIPSSSFPNGTITSSSAGGSGFSTAVGGTSPTYTPTPPSPLPSCNDPICAVLANGTLQQNPSPPVNPPPPQNPPPPVNLPPDNPPPQQNPPPQENLAQLLNTLATQQTTQLAQNQNFINPNTTPPPVLTSLDINAVTNSDGRGATTAWGDGSGGNGATQGSLASGKQGGNGAPPGVRLVDMPRIPLPPGSGLPPPGETRFLANQLVLQFDAALSQQQINDLVRRFGLTVEAQQTMGILGRPVYTVRINNGQSVREVIRLIQSSGAKAAVQPVYTYSLTEDGGANPDSANPGGDGDPAQYAVKKLQLAEAHRISKGENVIIAVIDSAIDAEQPDFAGGVIDRFDAGCGATAPDAHGTGMAGAIASHVQLLGVAPSAKILAICAFGGSGSAPEATSVKIIRGLDYAVQHGAKIVNMSFAGPYDPALAQTLQVAREKGVLIVAAAGNAGAKSPPLYPGADPNVMAITATDENDRLFAGANQGKYVALAAPGVNILVPAPNGGVQMTTGTSVATANVSGVAALLLAQKPSRTPEEIRGLLVSTAKHLGARGINPQFGAGLVDPLGSLREAPALTAPSSAAVAPAGRIQ